MQLMGWPPQPDALLLPAAWVQQLPMQLPRGPAAAASAAALAQVLPAHQV